MKINFNKLDEYSNEDYSSVEKIKKETNQAVKDITYFI